jgi:hypothetical protein
MKKYLFLIVLTSLLLNGFSQETNLINPEKNKGKDLLIIDFFTDLWQNVPAVANVRAINQGINAYTMLNFPIGFTNFSLAGGIGISSHNFYSDVIILSRDVSNQQLTGTSEFMKLGDYYGRKIDYSINKLNITYLDIPLEIKFKTRAERNKRIKASVGFKIGCNFSNHTKYRGEDVIENTSDVITFKKSNIKYVNKWNYGITGRIGYGRYNIMVYYSFSKIFEKDKGPQIYPVSIGISITPF